MSNLWVIVGSIVFVLGVILAVQRDVDRRHRIMGGLLALVSLFMVLYVWMWSPNAELRRSMALYNRQGYVLGYGLGQYLKQTQSGRQLALLRTRPEIEFDGEVVKGLKAGLQGGLRVVTEHQLDMSKTDYPSVAALYTKDLLVDLKKSGVDIVVSFLPPSIRYKDETVFDLEGTREWWSSPEYSALQWVFPRSPGPFYPWPTGYFREAKVLAMVKGKPYQPSADGIPANLEIKGTPSELFNAWFELITSDDGG